MKKGLIAVIVVVIIVVIIIVVTGKDDKGPAKGAPSDRANVESRRPEDAGMDTEDTEAAEEGKSMGDKMREDAMRKAGATAP